MKMKMIIDSKIEIQLNESIKSGVLQIFRLFLSLCLHFVAFFLYHLTCMGHKRNRQEIVCLNKSNSRSSSIRNYYYSLFFFSS